MTDEKIISHAKLVDEQVKRSQNEASVGAAITAARVQKWFEDEHPNVSWRRVVEQSKQGERKL